MKQKFCILTMLESTPLGLAAVRSLLNGTIYIEVEDNFFISCANNFVKPFNDALKAQQLTFILVFVNNKTGCGVFANGINAGDEKVIDQIILP